ncbi:MAG TPA: ABC transporter substrate-binding protein [Burkholderiales bacterium]|nr:ABC transporter substrate-binding protein [Burkholderiales bacterium]
MKRTLFRFLAAVLLLVTTCTYAQSGDPAARVKSFYATLLETMKDARRLGVEGRYKKLAPAVNAAFDLPAMTRIAVGPSWTTLTSEQQGALTVAFTRMTVATYANRFDGYDGERFEVEPKIVERGADRIVNTRLVTTGEAVTLNYLLRSSGGDWKIVDVYLSGTISELAARRSEFSAILKSGGPDALTKTLQARGDKLLSP